MDAAVDGRLRRVAYDKARDVSIMKMNANSNWSMKTSRVNEVISLMKSRDIRGLTRAISIVESNEEGKDDLLNDAFRRGSKACFTLGFTGAPGAGKSTLVNSVVRHFRKEGKTVGVLAVDPTSPFSGGAVLGDRIRMKEHNPDDGVYIRSLASRKALGGLSEAAKFALYLYKAYGFDVIIIETLGVGQDEIDVAKYVDVTALVLVPGYGDHIQLAKAGIMEIADIFIINKSDRPGADLLKKQILNTMHMKPEDERPPVINTIAERNEGIAEVMAAVESVRSRAALQRDERYRGRIAEEIRSSVLSQLARETDLHLEDMVEKVLKSSLTPIEAAKEILALLRN
jgi:LAO/AO transport system kinase